MSRPPRIRGFSYLGTYRYFVTFCTFDRRDVFSDHAIAQAVVSQFRRTCRRKKFAILAYCLMPDHVHLLVEGMSDTADFRRLIKSLKQSSSQACSSRVRGAGPVMRRVPSHRGPARRRYPLWQEGYYDRVLRAEDDARVVARYIIENPVRAGLARAVEDYPSAGSDLWTLEQLMDSLL